MPKLLLMGDEAIARGAIDAGLSGIYAYPGTPSTEITEYVERSKEAREGIVHYSWAANEKTAVEAALGMSYAGKRAMACMKHVGLNVAADPFINSAITGANGGIVIVSADDPSMHSSQNEQDSRFFGKFAMLPVLEPSDQQEAYDMAYYSFELSEKTELPVLIRITTRLAHSRSSVVTNEKKTQNQLTLPKDPVQYVLMPANARKRYNLLLDKQKDLVSDSEFSGYNTFIDGTDKSLGIIISGIAYNYLMENYPGRICPYPIVKIGQYPLPVNLLKKLYIECESILVIEEGYPLIEEQLPLIISNDTSSDNNSKFKIQNSKLIKGRFDGTIPRAGELNPAIIGKALGIEHNQWRTIPAIVAGRPPKLCQGCPHIDSYKALNEAMSSYSRGRVLSDIGCYTLGALPPYNAINSCVDMGASITMAKGAADAGLVPAVAVIGDSTFTHSGMTGLLDAVNENSPITVIIADNSITAMTGGQFSPASGKIEDICKGLGVSDEHIRLLDPKPKYHDLNVSIIKEELEFNGVSVIIPRRDCIVEIGKNKKKKNKIE